LEGILWQTRVKRRCEHSAINVHIIQNGDVNTQRSMCTLFKTVQWSCTLVH